MAPADNISGCGFLSGETSAYGVEFVGRGASYLAFFALVFPVLLHSPGDFEPAGRVHGTASASGGLILDVNARRLELFERCDDRFQFVPFLTQVLNDSYQIQPPDPFRFEFGARRNRESTSSLNPLG